jgi:hypothetical protein
LGSIRQKPQQPEEPEDDVGIACRVGHELPRLQFGLVLKQTIQDVRRIVERAGDHDAMEAGELIAGKIVVGDPTLHMEIFAVVTSVEGAHGNHEPESIR